MRKNVTKKRALQNQEGAHGELRSLQTRRKYAAEPPESLVEHGGADQSPKQLHTRIISGLWSTRIRTERKSEEQNVETFLPPPPSRRSPSRFTLQRLAGFAEALQQTQATRRASFPSPGFVLHRQICFVRQLSRIQRSRRRGSRPHGGLTGNLQWGLIPQAVPSVLSSPFPYAARCKMVASPQPSHWSEAAAVVRAAAE